MVVSVKKQLEKHGYAVVDFSDDELAKLHVRHLGGGRAAAVRDERPCRFEFPERPGALLEFLDALGGRWNISLFHYRNHGAAFGRVLIGIDVPPTSKPHFQRFLDRIGYTYFDETQNRANHLFL